MKGVNEVNERNDDMLQRLVGLINEWRTEAEDHWKNSLMESALGNDSERVRLQDRSAILFHNANQIEEIIQPNIVLCDSADKNTKNILTFDS